LDIVRGTEQISKSCADFRGGWKGNIDSFSSSKVVLLADRLRSCIRAVYNKRNVETLEVVDYDRDIVEHLHTNIDGCFGGRIDVRLGVAANTVLLLNDNDALPLVFETDR
jgi:hypothetical protein